jgi:hypothetical protein
MKSRKSSQKIINGNYKQRNRNVEKPMGNKSKRTKKEFKDFMLFLTGADN